jgi:hypothetical protein|tara:strand:+ start:21 stop:545 length:525 start_codon:yes stop_codon:yes gene_type:complete
MGYTHYWRQQRDFTETEWQELTRLTKLILADFLKLQLYSELNINKEEIRFNGKGDDGHETFLITKKKRAKADYEEQHAYDKKGAFNFCKTAHKPYDKYVVAVLCALYNLSDAPPQSNRSAHPMSEITSDGNTEDWTEGLFHAVRSTRQEEMYCPIRDCLTLSYVDYVDQEKNTG